MKIKFKEKNIYSLKSESYEIEKIQWYRIRDDVVKNNLDSSLVFIKYGLNEKQMWFLFDTLLQEKCNHLYKREKLKKVSLNDYVYCNHEGFGRGVVMSIFEDDLMLVKFDKRELPTMCSSSTFVTVFDDIKRKLTKL